jgi:DNA helicase-4
MTGFEASFGHGPQLALTTTFRCTQTICDVARAFVTKNPAQFKKAVRSVYQGGR